VSASDGLLDLHFVVAPDGLTRLARRDMRFPLRTTAPMYLDPVRRGMAFVYVQNPTGGVFPGDRLETRLALDMHAGVHVTTQSASKIYGPDEPGAFQTIEGTLAAGSYLELVPDVLIPQAASRYVQRLEITMARDAGFFMTEMVAPGRLAGGERFAYSALDLRTRVLDADGTELVADALFFEPERRPPDRRGLMGRFPFVGTALAVAPSCDVPELARAVEEACGGVGDDVFAAGCPVHGDIGVAVRALAASHRALRDSLDAVWAVVRDRLAGAPPPPRRK
jgi:urease accessory protein